MTPRRPSFFFKFTSWGVGGGGGETTMQLLGRNSLFSFRLWLVVDGSWYYLAMDHLSPELHGNLMLICALLI
jgi:hypothetical protein